MSNSSQIKISVCDILAFYARYYNPIKAFAGFFADYLQPMRHAGLFVPAKGEGKAEQDCKFHEKLDDNAIKSTTKNGGIE